MDPDKQMLRLNEKGGNGRADGLATQERRLFNMGETAARAARWIVGATIAACVVWFGLVNRVAALEQKTEADKAMIVLKLEEMEKRLNQRFEDLNRTLEHDPNPDRSR